MKRIFTILLMVSFYGTVQAASFVVETPPENAIDCAVEGEECQLPAGVNATVWYGSGAQWITLTNQIASITCGPSTFDAIPTGTNNTCVYSQAAFDNGVVIQAEDAEFNGATVENSEAGADGAYVDFKNTNNDTLTWTVNVDKAGYAPLDIRYALGGNPRVMTLKVNGTVVNNAFSFPTTNAWNNWERKEVNVDLVAGANSITLEATGDSGPNVDSLTIIGNNDVAKLAIKIGRTAIGAENVVVFHEAQSGTNANIIDLTEQTVTLTNTSDVAILISGLTVSGNGFSLVDSSQSSGATLQPGDALDVEIQFNQSQRSVFTGNLTIFMEDNLPSTYQVPLRGLWNPNVSGGSEPTIGHIINVFGWANKADGTILDHNDINNNGVPNLIEGEPTIEINGQQQQAYYFEAADPNQTVTLQQIGAFHINGGRSVTQMWRYDYDETLGAVNQTEAYSGETSLLRLVHDARQGNTLLQYEDGLEPQQVFGTTDFNGPFLFTLDGRSTDPARNEGYQAVRVLEIYDQKTGLRLENSYLLTMDYAGPGANYDYNDNVYIVTNIKPFDGEVSGAIPPVVNLGQPVATKAGFVSGHIEAFANDPDGTIDRVEFYYESNLLSTATAAPFIHAWENDGNGIYPIYARAYDNDGGISDSNIVEIVVDDTQQNAFPVVTLNQPVTTVGNVSGSMTASATDADGNIDRVEFYYNGNNLLETLTEAPYTLHWAGVANGTYTVTAKAYDNLGAETVSNLIEVTVDDTAIGTNEPPTVILNAPITSGGSVSGAITAIANDADGTIDRVEIYYNGDNLLETLTEAPYTVQWVDAPDGTYALTAVAFDDAGAEVTSNVVTVVVDSNLE